MKKSYVIVIGIAWLMVAGAITTSCGESRIQTASVDSTEEDTVGRVRKCIEYFQDAVERVRPVYYSELAIKAPEYENASPFTGPFGLLDYLTDKENHMDVYPINEAGGLFYQIGFKNLVEDTVHVNEVHFQDDKFDVYWDSPEDIEEGSFAFGPWLRVDSGLNLKNYKMVITYKDNQYPPQTFYLNFHPKRIPKVLTK